jgi:hypothetical protein
MAARGHSVAARGCTHLRARRQRVDKLELVRHPGRCGGGGERCWEGGVFGKERKVEGKVRDAHQKFSLLFASAVHSQTTRARFRTHIPLPGDPLPLYPHSYPP